MAEIFLMEDSPSLRRIITRYLRDAEHNVTAFENGMVSRDEAMLKTADVLVTDLSMPEIDGRQALRNIHMLCPQLPVIVITGVERFSDPVLDMAFGYLHKPFHEQELLDLVERAIESRGQSGNESRSESQFANSDHFVTTRKTDIDYSTMMPANDCDGATSATLYRRVMDRLAQLLSRSTASPTETVRKTGFISTAIETRTSPTGHHAAPLPKR